MTTAAQINVYNTSERKIVPLKPLAEGKLGMYVCGPTVYGPAHIGHARTYAAFDIIRRYLEYRGFGVKHVINITDIHDDIMKKANEQGITIFELADRNIRLFFRDMDGLGIERAIVYPRVTEYVEDIIRLVKTLQDKGFAYETDDGVYYKVSAFKDYGKLSGIKREKGVTGTRVETDKYEKEEAMDFALWKKAKKGEPFWESPWGKGRPGWHIECSAMAMKNLGETIDIHGGAKDLIFPHHENEIAQSEAASGKRFVNYWLHTGLLTINGEKMSKSLGNYIEVPDLLARYNPKVFRFFIAGTHYRSEIDFSEEAMVRARTGLEKINNFIQSVLAIREKKGGNRETGKERIEKEKEGKEISILVKGAEEAFCSAMDNDFASPMAVAGIFDFVRTANKLLSEGKISRQDAEKIISFMKKIDSVFNCFDFEEKKDDAPGEVLALLNERAEAKNKKDWAKADEIRKKIDSLGYAVSDTPEGAKIARKA